MHARRVGPAVVRSDAETAPEVQRMTVRRFAFMILLVALAIVLLVGFELLTAHT